MAKVFPKMKRLVQTIKEKINGLAAERPDLFLDVGDDTSERLDHLISTIQNQAAQIVYLQQDRDDFSRK